MSEKKLYTPDEIEADLQKEYKGTNFFPYPWQFEIPESGIRRFNAVCGIVQYLEKSQVSRGLREAWKDVQRTTALSYVEELAQVRDKTLSSDGT